MDKQELRDIYKTIRMQISQEQVSAKSFTICQNLLNEIDFSKIFKLCVYKPIEKLNEVDVSNFIETVRRQYSEVKIYSLALSKNQNLPHQKFNLIIVPTLAFDDQNYRLGWGSGFYDKFLAQQPQAKKIGLCFKDGFIEGGFAHEAHDIALDKVITD